MPNLQTATQAARTGEFYVLEDKEGERYIGLVSVEIESLEGPTFSVKLNTGSGRPRVFAGEDIESLVPATAAHDVVFS